MIHENSINSVSKEYSQRYDEFVSAMEENAVSPKLLEIAEELWEGTKKFGILTSVEYNPFDSLGGSVNFMLATMPESHYLKLWYTPQKQVYLMSFFHRIAGTLERQIPDTFNEDGIQPFLNLDQFSEWFLDMLTKEDYNRKHKKVFSA